MLTIDVTSIKARVIFRRMGSSNPYTQPEYAAVRYFSVHNLIIIPFELRTTVKYYRRLRNFNWRSTDMAIRFCCKRQKNGRRPKRMTSLAFNAIFVRIRPSAESPVVRLGFLPYT